MQPGKESTAHPAQIKFITGCKNSHLWVLTGAGELFCLADSGLKGSLMLLAEYLKKMKIDDIEDDQEFMDAEYHAVRAYCDIYGYSVTDADMETIRARGLEETFENWKGNDM